MLELAGQSAAGQGVSTDIIEAAAQAYVRALSNAERKVHARRGGGGAAGGGAHADALVAHHACIRAVQISSIGQRRAHSGVIQS